MKMKQRIKEIVDSNGVSEYIVQSKFIFFWCDDVRFDSMEKALNWGNYVYDSKVIIHNIN